MRAVSALLGAGLLAIGTIGLLLIGLGLRDVIQLEVTRLAMRLGMLPMAAPVEPATPLTPEELAELLDVAPVTSAEISSQAASAAERIQIPRIRLEAEVVTAPLVRAGSGITWEVPAHRVGHAQTTAGAGGRGNTMLLGHVSSLNAGNVFKDLEGIRAGDDVVVHGGGSSYRYLVTDVRRVTRDDLSVMAQGEGSVVTLLTCIGTWLPDVHDYSHRLAVRAELVV